VVPTIVGHHGGFADKSGHIGSGRFPCPTLSTFLQPARFCALAALCSRRWSPSV
jgi:hypothetical protein